jgi:glucose/arabinose dehydrogenase
VHRRHRILAVAVAMTLSTALAPARTLAVSPVLSPKVVHSGLVNPWDVAFAPGGQMFVTERPGRVRVYQNGNPGGSLLATTTIGHVRAEGESGVMGIAVDHLFSETRLIYVCVSRQIDGAWRNQVIRYHVKHDWHLQFDRFLVRHGMRANTIHNGCAVEEGPDHKIWVTMGDANHPYDAQDPDKLNGKVLRINRDGTAPAGNPIWPGHSQPSKVYTIGHRNPQGISFQPGTGRVYEVEHGPDVNDEINWIRKGRNYGWPCVTGRGRPYLSCSGSATFTKSVWNSGDVTLATSNGTFVKGGIWLGFDGHLFVATLKESDLRRFKIDPDGAPARQRAVYFNARWGRLRATVLGPGNRLWITTSNGTNDKVIRITPTAP